MNRCPVTGCAGEREKAWHLVCPKHWEQLPAELRESLWVLFRTRRGSKAHLAAIKQALHVLAAGAP